MMYKTLLLGLLASSSNAHVVKKQPVMKLRGGLAGLDTNQVANVVLSVSAANSAVMALAPKKAGEMYGVASTKWADFFAQWSGLLIFGQTLTTFLALGGMSFTEAMGWGFVPGTIAAIQDLLNDKMVSEMGMGTHAKFMPPLVNIVLTLGLLGKLPFLGADLALKVAAFWMGLNGLYGYLATDAWLEGWGGSGLTSADAGMGKLMAQTMTAGAAQAAAVAFMGKSAMESWGILMAVYLASNIDFMYISKTLDSMGVDSAKGLFWAALQALSVGVVFF